MNRQIIHVTAGFPPRPAMQMLEESSRANGLDYVALPRRHYVPRLFTMDKVRLLRAFLATGALSSTDVVMFTDAYDVLVTQHASLIHERFLAFDADIVVNAEANMFPSGHPHLQQLFEENSSKWRYLNSGCYIGYVGAVKIMMDYIAEAMPKSGGDEHYMDQLLMQMFYARGAAEHQVCMRLDTQTAIFAPMMMAEENFQLERFGVRNRITGALSCVLHANGDRANMNILSVVDGMRKRDAWLACASAGPDLLFYNRDTRRLNADAVGELLLIAVRGDLAIAFTEHAPYLTFRPEGLVPCDAASLREWETLMLRDRSLTTDHGSPLGAYVDGADGRAVTLSPLSFKDIKTRASGTILGAVDRILAGG